MGSKAGTIKAAARKASMPTLFDLDMEENAS